MARGTKRALPARVEAVRRRIERWRQMREKRTRMPEDLWDSAVAVARRHGLWAVSRALRVNYECLKGRCGRAEGVSGEGKAAGEAGFVEFGGHLIGGHDGTRTLVELTSADGSKLTVRLGGPESVDVMALADAFWSRDR